jgi:ribosomal-protein-alanine N-acetyltransferase
MCKVLKRFKKYFFNVIKSPDKVIGYCAYYLKLKLYLKGFEKQSAICSIAADRNFKGKSFTERLLNESIEEIKKNKI